MEVAAIASGASVSGSTARAMAARLETTFQLLGQDITRCLIEVDDMLPGLGTAVGAGPAKITAFKDLKGPSIDALVAAKRLGSPQHYRYYFAFSQPAGALPDEQVQAFIAAAERDPMNAAQMFANFSRDVRPQGGTLAEVLLERMIAWSGRIPGMAIPGILVALAQNMDSVVFSAAGDFGERPAWRTATHAVKVLLARTEGKVRETSLHILFADGQALGWLSQLLRSEIFSHGHYGDQPEPEERRLLTTDEFGEVLAEMLRRYRETPPAKLLQVPELLSLLYAWLQGGGKPDEPKRWVKRQIARDAGLLAFLSRARGWASVNGAVYYPLKRRDLAGC